MSNLSEVENLLSRLTKAEKSLVLQWVVSDLSNSYPGIEINPQVCGGEPCIIEQANYVDDYILHLRFDDGKEIKIDFAPFLQQSLNPLIRRYLDVEQFKKFTVEYGGLHWNDYDLCFPIADLYEGQI